jgi:hypothetical protein
MTNSIDITPSPRILRMLGQIDFSAIQCLSELIDNSIDAFQNLDDGKKFQPEIIVRIPKTNRQTPDKAIFITDNGQGMNIDQLNRSLKAGFSSNSPIDKMGLFGMGFNIATARLGQKTEIVTSKAGDPFQYKVTIDFQMLESLGNYEVPIEQIPKAADESDKHGTEIKISNLNWEHIRPLRQKTKVAKHLGKTYGRIIKSKRINLVYEGHTCTPFSHCVWSKLRVGRNGISAIIDIDKVIDTKRYCTSCWVWLVNTDVTCPACGETHNLADRERRVKGWIGVQRFFDETHYGFDLIRNGRVIRSLDKELFSWKSEDDEKDLEYPLDGYQSMGRFVGELEIDFVQVTHQKDAFETLSTDWHDFVSVVRGNGPIRPQIAKRHGYPENHSPLAKLFSTFRTMKAGKANLVPARAGTTQAMIRESVITDYRNRFFENEYEYLEDDKWWNLILKAEKPETKLEPDDNEDDQTGGDPFGQEDEDDFDTGDDDQEIETKDQFERDERLSGPYSIDMFKNTKLKVDASQAKSGSHPNGFVVSPKGALLEFKYWPNSKIFEETFLRPEDLLINELAYLFFITSDERLENVPISLVERSIKKRYFPDLQPEISRINDEIINLSRDLKDHLRTSIKNLDNFNINILSPKSIEKIRKRMAQGELLSKTEMQNALNKGEFLNFADLPVLVELFENYPRALFDGIFFIREIPVSTEYDEIEQGLVNDAKSIFRDIVWWHDNGTPNSSDVWKGRSRRVVGSLEVLRGWRV